MHGYSTLRFENHVISQGSKTWNLYNGLHFQFENHVISQGSKTSVCAYTSYGWFENHVISQGSKTSTIWLLFIVLFENHVISQGSKTNELHFHSHHRFENHVISQGSHLTFRFASTKAQSTRTKAFSCFIGGMATSNVTQIKKRPFRVVFLLPFLLRKQLSFSFQNKKASDPIKIKSEAFAHFLTAFVSLAMLIFNQQPERFREMTASRSSPFHCLAFEAVAHFLTVFLPSAMLIYHQKPEIFRKMT